MMAVSARLSRLLITVCLVLATSTQAFGALKLLPETIGAGGEVRLIGSEYIPEQSLSAMLRISPGSELLLESFMADDDGSFMLDVMIPPEAEAGSHEIVIRSATGLELDAEAIRMAEAPLIVVNPVSGIPGQAIDIQISRLQPGTVEVLLDGVNVLGPAGTSSDDFTGSFHVPLGNEVGTADLRVKNRVGRRVFSEATTPFEITVPKVRVLDIENVHISSQTLTPGQRFQVSADVVVPDGQRLSDYTFSLVWKTADGLMVPINQQEVTVQGNNVVAEGFPPSLSSGAIYGLWGEEDEMGFVYVNPAGQSGYIRAGVSFSYDHFEPQQFTVQVLDSISSEPIENAYVTLNTNTQLIDHEENDSPAAQTRAGSGSNLHLTTYSGTYQGPNQIDAAKMQITDLNAAPTSCPITLAHGPTDANGEFGFLTTFSMMEVANQIAAQGVGDINTHVPSPGNPKFSVVVNALAKGYGPTNSQGKGTVVRFDFMFDFENQMWFLRDGPDGAYDIPFNPNTTLQVPLPPWDGEIEFPGMPFIEGLHSDPVLEDGVSVTHIKTLVSFPDPLKWPESLFGSISPAEVRMPFNELTFGPISDMKLYLNGQYQSDFERTTGETCSGDDVEFFAEIPGAHRLPAGTHYGTIEGTLGEDLPISAQFAIVAQEGSDWFLDDNEYHSQFIWWAADEINIFADEYPSENDASVGEVEHVGSMNNDNASGAKVSESTGGAKAESSRNRYPDSDATVSGNSGGSSEGSSSIEFEIAIPFGDENSEITIVDTGKIPLFRYSWGVDPIVGATFGADFWLRVFYRYWGEIKLTLEGILLDLAAAPAIEAGIDVFFELGALFGLISAKATASPSIGIELPIVITENSFDTEASQPCFNFKLDVLIELAVVIVEESWMENILTVAEPPDCEVGASALAMIQSIRVTPPPDIHPSIATDGQGYTMTAWEDSGGLSVQTMQMNIPDFPETLETGPGTIKPRLASFAPGTFLMVWSQSALNETDFAAMALVDALPHQHMVWALHDGNAWSTINDLTLPTTGEGGAILAACPASDPDCPSGGEVLAVWERDTAGDFTQHAIRLHYARYSGLTGAWGSVQALDPGSTAKELGATATYVQGEPVVMWVRNDSLVKNGGSVEIDLNESKLAYRWLDQTAGVQIPGDLPGSATNPSINALSDGSLVATYTVSTEPDAFIGNKRALHTAMGTCSGGICSWNDREQRSSDNRRIFAESPKVIVNDSDNVTVHFRHLGYDTILESDPLSIQMMTGDAAQIPVVFENLVSDVQYVTQNGAVNWKLTPLFDPATDSIVSLGVNSSLTQQQLRQLGLPDDALRKSVPGVTSRSLGGGFGGPVLHNVPQAPELEMVAATVNEIPAESGDKGLLTVTVRNNGTPVPPDTLVTISAAWNAPPGAGPEAGATQILINQVGQPLTVELDLAPPPGYHEDAPNQLYVTLNPGQAIAESDGANNTIVLQTGALPVPQNLTSTSTSDSPLIYIHWDPVDDPRVTAYRIYRINPDGNKIHVGTSDVAGFMDMSGWPGNLYQYQVSAMSARAFESELSDPIHALAQSNEYDPNFGLLFQDRFEGP